jgi:hypothetical protein
MRVARAAFMICVICLASGVALAKSKPKPKPKPFTNATIRISGTAFTLGAFCTGYAANCPGGGCTCYQDQTAKAKGPLLPKKASADLTLNVDESDATPAGDPVVCKPVFGAATITAAPGGAVETVNILATLCGGTLTGGYTVSSSNNGAKAYGVLTSASLDPRTSAIGLTLSPLVTK